MVKKWKERECVGWGRKYLNEMGAEKRKKKNQVESEEKPMTEPGRKKIETESLSSSRRGRASRDKVFQRRNRNSSAGIHSRKFAPEEVSNNAGEDLQGKTRKRRKFPARRALAQLGSIKVYLSVRLTQRPNQKKGGSQIQRYRSVS